MVNCYICGNAILDTKKRFRRKVRTGYHDRRVYPSGKVVSVQTHYGQRVVCQFCARRVDRERRMREYKDLLFIGCVLFALVVALMLLGLSY